MARQFVAQRELIVVQRELQNAYDKLAALANTDMLTGLPNHRSLSATIEREVARARRSGRPLALLFLDIDHFKALNDSAGHAAGDGALAEFSSLVAGCLRASDVLGRWGGEEFIALLPEAGAEEAHAVAERVRSGVEDHVFGSAGRAGLTCSIGVAVHREDAPEALSLIDAGDRAMYTAKRLGRNRVIVSWDAAPTIMGMPTTSRRDRQATTRDAPPRLTV
jgi:diguanylate cyclase (GGDEF)-like protein